MFKTFWKYLSNEGGWISAGIAAAGLISNIVGQSQKGKGGVKEAGYSKMLRDRIIEGDQTFGLGDTGNVKSFINPAIEAAKSGGLMPAISEAFSQRPSSAEMDAIARQELNLKNKALNTGARGGLLRQQMFEAAKNAASNKLNLMENARQNALQRAFQTFSGVAPTERGALGWQQLGMSGTGTILDAEMKRKMGNAASEEKEGGMLGGGLGSILGSLGGSLGGLLGAGGNATQAQGAMGPTMEGGGFTSSPFSVIGSWF